MDAQVVRRGVESLDRAAGARVRAKLKPTPRHCFINAMLAMRAVSGTVYYVEGWAALDIAPIPTAHGWLETRGGRIIECTTESYKAYYPVRRWLKPWPLAARRGQTPLLDFEFLRDKKVRESYEALMLTEYGVDMAALRSGDQK